MIVAGGKHHPSYGYMASIRISFVFLNLGLLRRRLSRPRTNGNGYAAGREGGDLHGWEWIYHGVSAGILKGRPAVFEREISLGFEQVFFLFLFPFSREISKPFCLCV